MRYLVNSIVFICLIVCSCTAPHSQSSSHPYKIDRHALVTRQNIVVIKFDTLSSLTVGNGDFAFTVDATGLQTFPNYYSGGVPLGTLSQWGWHSFPNPHHYTLKDIYKKYDYYGRKIPYAYSSDATARQKAATNWLRANPHRIDLGRIGFEITKADGTPATRADFTHIHQELNLWTGIIHSHFEVDGEPVDVQTLAHQKQDLLAVKVISPLVTQGRLKVNIRFAYAAGKWDRATDWNDPGKHQTILRHKGSHQGVIEHIMDATHYFATLTWNGAASIKQQKVHSYDLTPAQHPSDDTLSFTCLFSKTKPPEGTIPDFQQTKDNSITQWKQFWTTGGAIDLSGSTDPRAKELERRIVLSQYLTKIQCDGPWPPQETGLTYDSWYGKFHLEMHLWHAAQFALWNRIGLARKEPGLVQKD